MQSPRKTEATRETETSFLVDKTRTSTYRILQNIEVFHREFQVHSWVVTDK